MYVHVCVYEDNLSFTREPLDVETRNERSKVSDCHDCWVSGLNILWRQVGPPGGQKRLFFGPRHTKPIQAMLFCVGLAMYFESCQQKQ